MAKGKNQEKINKMKSVLVSSNEFVVLDIETTGLSPLKGGRIIEIGAVKIVNEEIVDTFSQLIYPEMKIYKKIIDITGITNEMLSDKPVFREVLPKFYKFIGNTTVVAHNSGFDWDRFLLFYFSKVGIIPTNQVVDTLLLSRELFPNASSHKLEDICRELGIVLSNAHRAENDAIATSKLFLEIRKLCLKDFNAEQSEQTDLFNMTAIEREEPNKLQSPKNNFVIKRIAYWEKQVSKKKRYERIYVTLDIGVAYFDIPTRTWGIDKCEHPVDLKVISGRTVEELKTKTFKHAKAIEAIKNSVIEIDDMLVS